MLPPSAHELLVAEAEAFPFNSLAAYRAATTALTRKSIANDNLAEETPETTALANALEDRLRLHANGLSLEALRQLRLRVWFNDPADTSRPFRTSVPLHEYLAFLAKTYIAFRGRRAILNPTHSNAGATHEGGIDALHMRAMRYRWLSLRIPPDLLIGASAHALGITPDCGFVDLGTPHLARLLEKPVADTHLHLGQGTNFGDVWRALMAQLASGYAEDALKLDAKTGVPEYAVWGDPKDYADRYHTALLLAGTVRLWLARFLATKTRPFAEFLRELADKLAFALVWPDVHDVIRAAHRAIQRPEAAPRRVLLRKLYVGMNYAQVALSRQIPGPVISPLRKSAPEVLQRDPACFWLGDEPEMALLQRGLAYLKATPDKAFASAFWQYQRLRCMTYNFVTQDPGVGGLDWFQRFSARLGPLRSPLDQTLVTSAHALQSRDVNLAALEVRSTPRADWSKTWGDVRVLAQQLCEISDLRRPQAGMVLHFIKQRNLAGDAPNGVRWAFGGWARARWREAKSTEFMLRQRPETLVFVRGLDVAAAELSMPLWPTLRPLKHLRRVSQEVAAELGYRYPHLEAPPLRLTYHAGEDFRRLNEGIRRVHELVLCGLLEAGDRVGHGLAIGIDPEKWAARSPCMEQPQAERLDDLLWELDLYGRGWIAPSSARVERARAEAMRIGRQIHGGDAPVDDLLEARRRKHKPDKLTALGFPDALTPRAPVDTADRLLLDELRRPVVFGRGQVPIEVNVDAGEVEMLRAAGDFVRRELARLEVTVETNPSSNLLIGRYESVDEHPIFRMFPRRGHERPGEIPIQVSLNVDDPVAFASRMADEYAHVYFALLRGGVPARDALEWLDQVRENGYASRFTLEASRDDKALALVAI